MMPKGARGVRLLVAFAAMEDDPLAKRHAAYEALRAWAKVNRQRDKVIRAAVAAGVDQRSITEITGVARTTIARIVARNPLVRSPISAPGQDDAPPVVDGRGVVRMSAR